MDKLLNIDLLLFLALAIMAALAMWHCNWPVR